MSGDPQLYARSFADVYDRWYGHLDDPTILVGSIARRYALPAAVVELGSGTGRLATPLHEAGFDVVALDASQTMLAAARPGPAPVAADMVDLPIASGSVDLVLVAYNTLLNLSSRRLQQRCFHEASRVLRPGGAFAVEAFVADPLPTARHQISFREHPALPDARVAIVTGPDVDDEHMIIGTHVELGPTITCRPWKLVYQSPTSLDDIAAAARLELRERHSDWAGSDFDTESTRHVSWYERI